MNKEFLISNWRDRVSNPVIEAFNAVPRENFVLENLRDKAYEDYPLPILREKTISQPSTVVLMTEALGLKSGQKVLEIGSGSGYQAAIISHIVGEKGEVITTEVIPELVSFARENLARLNITNIKVVEHDGSQGFIDNSPYDRIIFTAASPQIPLQLLDQLKVNGILVAPVGDLQTQHLVKLIKHEDSIEQKDLGEFLFSPLVGKFGFEEDRLG